ncbi:cytochrome P450 [Lactifluus volemus]|nr:cytochrome P450 [Lactifluus volemus]
MLFTFSHLFITSLVSSIVYVLLRRKRRSSFPFPPGPKHLPFIGNLLNVPFKYQWLAYEKWGKETGSDIVHAELFGTHLVALNSEKVARDLLEKRSSIYSDRLDAGKWVFSLFPYSNKWRTWHKAFYAQVQPSMARQYHPMQVKAARQLLRNLCDTPQDFLKHLRYMPGQASLSVAYGINVAQTKGRIFNLVPFLIHLPWWFPGASFKKDAEMWKRNLDRCRDEPYEAVKKALEENKAVPSIATSTITELSENSTPETILMAKALPSTVYLAGIDTSTAGLQSFVLAMVLYPEIQRRAQEEIDSVLGPDHLPDFGDEDALPYVKAVFHEVLRWSPPGPLGIPHRLTEDDVYEGYFIPAGSLVFPNIWAIMHDPITYPEPSKFKPERFLDPVTPEPLPEAAFGYGRRICPGRFFARDVLWVGMASMLSAYEFLPATDTEGHPMPPAQEFTSLFASGPIPFKCTIRPRSSISKEAVLATLQE